MSARVAQLPDSGMCWPEKKEIIALKERLRQEAEATALLLKAIEAKDISALEGALQVSDNLEMQTPEVVKARALLESMREQVAAREVLRNLIKEKAPSRADLETAIARAENAGISEYTETREARAILGRILAEEEANRVYEAAKAGGDVVLIDQALAKFTELGLPLPKGAKAARDAIVQKQARDKQEREVRENLQRAEKAKDVEAAEAQLEVALQLGITGREVDNARKFVKDMREKVEAIAHAKAQAEVFDGKMHSAVGLTEADLQEMKTALSRAEAAGARTPEKGREEALEVRLRSWDLLGLNERLICALADPSGGEGDHAEGGSDAQSSRGAQGSDPGTCIKSRPLVTFRRLSPSNRPSPVLHCGFAGAGL